MTRTNILRHCLPPAIAWALLIPTCCFTEILHATESPNDPVAPNARADETLATPLPNQSPIDGCPDERNTHTENELRCLALNIYFEARSEPEEGQYAVGHVVMNRMASKYYPNTACEVVQQGGEIRLHHCQFSWWCDGQSDKPLNRKAWVKSMKIANAIYSGHSEDPTNGALWYHADYVNPYWKDELSVLIKIGQHVFYEKKRRSEYAFN
jgi:spore germination cell wall hydrolase CwlJ-like protein